jgi:hypothetical protein
MSIEKLVVSTPEEVVVESVVQKDAPAAAPAPAPRGMRIRSYVKAGSSQSSPNIGVGKG